MQNTQTQTQNPNTQKIESPNPDLNLWVLWGAYVCFHVKMLAFTETLGIFPFQQSRFFQNLIRPVFFKIYTHPHPETMKMTKQRVLGL